MKLRDKLIGLLGGVPKAKYDLMHTVWECEAGRKNSLLRQLGQSVEIVSDITVRPEDASGMGNKELQEYAESELVRGILSEAKKHMVVEERRDITGVVTYRGTIMVFERNEER